MRLVNGMADACRSIKGEAVPYGDVTVDFDDSIIEDKQTERAEDRKDVAMGAMGLPEYRAKWYGETEEVAASKLPDQSAGVLM